MHIACGDAMRAIQFTNIIIIIIAERSHFSRCSLCVLFFCKYKTIGQFIFFFAITKSNNGRSDLRKKEELTVISSQHTQTGSTCNDTTIYDCCSHHHLIACTFDILWNKMFWRCKSPKKNNYSLHFLTPRSLRLLVTWNLL